MSPTTVSIFLLRTTAEVVYVNEGEKVRGPGYVAERKGFEEKYAPRKGTIIPIEQVVAEEGKEDVADESTMKVTTSFIGKDRVEIQEGLDTTEELFDNRRAQKLVFPKLVTNYVQFALDPEAPRRDNIEDLEPAAGDLFQIEVL